MTSVGAVTIKSKFQIPGLEPVTFNLGGDELPGLQSVFTLLLLYSNRIYEPSEN